jgi:hypothetical protein
LLIIVHFGDITHGEIVYIKLNSFITGSENQVIIWETSDHNLNIVAEKTSAMFLVYYTEGKSLQSWTSESLFNTINTLRRKSVMKLLFLQQQKFQKQKW